jgi:hypothetical protein
MDGQLYLMRIEKKTHLTSVCPVLLSRMAARVAIGRVATNRDLTGRGSSLP